MQNNFDSHYNINNDIINNYEINKNRNYYLLINLNNINNEIDNEINKLINEYNYGNNFSKILFLHNEINDNNNNEINENNNERFIEDNNQVINEDNKKGLNENNKKINENNYEINEDNKMGFLHDFVSTNYIKENEEDTSNKNYHKRESYFIPDPKYIQPKNETGLKMDIKNFLRKTTKMFLIYMK